MGTAQVIANNLRFLLQKNDIQQKDLADALHVDKSAVTHWLHGRGMPRVDKLDAICDYFSITCAELVSENAFATDLHYYKVTEQERDFFCDFERLTVDGKQEAARYIQYLLSQDHYAKDTLSQRNQDTISA